MKEEWRNVVGYEGYYQVSNKGRVKSLKRIDPNNHLVKERILTPNKDKYGYDYVGLSKYGKTKSYKSHRLVAKAFIYNPNNHPVINHKDFNKDNNCVDNLEWCTVAYNNTHRFKYKPINQLGTKNHRFSGYVLVFKNNVLIDILRGKKDMKNKGYNQCNVSNCVLGKSKTHHGCTFKRISIEEYNKKYLKKTL